MTFRKFVDAIDSIIKGALETIGHPEVKYSLTEPPNKEFGDVSCNVAFLLSKKLKQSPYDIAIFLVDTYINSRIASRRLSIISDVEAHQAGYINFRANYALLGNQTLKAILDGSYSKVDIGSGKRVIIEHTSINPNKALHVGHMRNVVLGDCLYRIFNATNYRVSVLNYVDDSGLQVADMIVGFKYAGISTEPTNNLKFDQYCGSHVYVKVNQLYAKNEKLKAKRKVVMKELDEGNPLTLKFAREMTNRVLIAQLVTCTRLRARYDLLNFESHILHSGLWKSVFQLLKDNRIIEFENSGSNSGCWVFKSGDEEKVIVRSDGTATYIAKDIPYASLKTGIISDPFYYFVFARQDDGTNLWSTSLDIEGNDDNHPQFFPAAESITIVDNRQNRLQLIIREILSRLEQASGYLHLSYAPVTLSSKTANNAGFEIGSRNYVQMSGRSGLFVDADYVLDLLHEKAKSEIKKRNAAMEEEEVDHISEQIAVSAIRYNLIKYDLDKVINFDIDDSLSLAGNSGPYVQYAHARAINVVKKSKSITFLANAELLTNDLELSLIRQLSKFEIMILETVKNVNPKLVAQYLYELADLFNTYYEKTPIMREKDLDISIARIGLTKATQLILAESLHLLGMIPLDKM
ncbi:MAG: arginine--tRNA ligase [Nitrososphaeraceae archaeon]